MTRLIEVRIFLLLFLLLFVLTNCEKEKKGSGLPVDADGNTYDTIVIGTQTWLTENLKTTKYINGDPILLLTENSSWIDINRGAYCWYNNDISNKDLHGALYNGFTARLTNFICPVGYHIPTNDDWSILINNMKDASEEMKQNFIPKQVGWRAAGGGAFQICCSCWWSSTPDYTDPLDDSKQSNYKVSLSFELSTMNNHGGYPIRCIKNN